MTTPATFGKTTSAQTAENAGAWKQFALLVKRNKAASIGIAAVLLVGGVLGTRAIVEGKRAERGPAVYVNFIVATCRRARRP